MVVVGRSSDIAAEVDIAACLRHKVPILRRSSGGSAILTGPGCLMYALVLNLERLPELRWVDRAHAYVLDRHVAALGNALPGVRRQGTSDLVLDGRKFSGNSLRIKRNHLLYHGTFLCNCSLEWMEKLLRIPPRQPAYREGRRHRDFVVNAPTCPETIQQALVDAWQADQPAADWPAARTELLVKEKYGLQQYGSITNDNRIGTAGCVSGGFQPKR
jgi:lipoate-protein ligase A